MIHPLLLQHAHLVDVLDMCILVSGVPPSQIPNGYRTVRITRIIEAAGETRGTCIENRAAGEKVCASADHNWKSACRMFECCSHNPDRLVVADFYRQQARDFSPCARHVSSVYLMPR